MKKVIINATDYRFGDSQKGKVYAKKVESIDTTKQNGYAFEGDFLPKSGQMELEVGTLILSVGYRGSWKNGCEDAIAFQVTDSGLKKLKDFGSYKENVIEIRNFFAEKLQTEKPNPLAEFTLEELKAEIERRKS